jgi:two-component system sensor kinase FixL
MLLRSTRMHRGTVPSGNDPAVPPAGARSRRHVSWPGVLIGLAMLATIALLMSHAVAPRPADDHDLPALWIAVALLGISLLLLLREATATRAWTRRAAHAAETALPASPWPSIRGVLDALPVAVVLLDEQGDIAVANMASASLFRCPRDAMAGRSLQSFVPCHGVASDRERYALANDGTETPVVVVLRVMHVDGRAMRLAILEDVSERRRGQAEATLQRNELAHLSRVKVIGELSGALAHELTQPLAAILTNAEAAQRMMDRTPMDAAEVREILSDIVESDHRAIDVIRRLRAWMRKDHNAFVPLEANAILVGATHLMRTTLTGRGVTMQMQLASDLPQVFGDHVQLEQVLVNLIINACDAMEGVPFSQATIVASSWLDAYDRVHLSVEDQGTGIAASIADSLFEPFETTKQQGMGLGLSVCRTIVQAHGGTIHARNNAGPGATAWIELPVWTP